MKPLRVLYIHLLCWLVVIGYQVIGYWLESASFSHKSLGTSILVIRIIQFYFCYSWVYPRFMKRGRVPQLILGIVAAIALFTTLRYIIEEVLFLKWFGFHNYGEGTTVLEYVIDNIYYGISYVVIAAAVYGMERSFRAEQTARKLRAEVVRAELAFLKSQVNPHFLYNSLNYIYSLALPVSDKLSEAVLRLSDLMRYTLGETPDGMSTLDKEVTYMRSYIELFKMRFYDDAFYVDLEVIGVAGQPVAGLILLPFVENAIKHGVANDPQHPIRIALIVTNNQLNFEVINRINNSQKDRSGGVGLVNIQRRLDLIYPESHTLAISNDGNIYKINLEINKL